MIFPKTILTRDRGSFSKKGNKDPSGSDYVTVFGRLFLSSSSFRVITSHNISSVKIDGLKPLEINKENHRYEYYTSFLERDAHFSRSIQIDINQEETKDRIYCALQKENSEEFLPIPPSNIKVSIESSNNIKKQEIFGGKAFFDDDDSPCLYFTLLVSNDLLDALLAEDPDSIFIKINLPLHTDRIDNLACLYEYPQTYILENNSFATLASISTRKESSMISTSTDEIKYDELSDYLIEHKNENNGEDTKKITLESIKEISSKLSENKILANKISTCVTIITLCFIVVMVKFLIY